MRAVATGYITDDLLLEHDTGPDHPESAARLRTVRRYLAEQNWFTDHLLHFSSNPIDLSSIEPIHPLTYIRRVETACRDGKRHLDCADVVISPASYEAALRAAAASITLADQIAGGELNNGFALLRPPGHHAERSMAMGFCLFNNIAITVRHLQRWHSVDKIAIVDWDVHHGNGTQHAFEEDPSVLYISLHQYPFYPGTGSSTETGTGRGEGATLNCPMKAGASDIDYMDAFNRLILPRLHEFRPEFLLISAGFDAHRDDPLAEIDLTTDCFGWMTSQLMEIAERYADKRLLSVLEGGYNLDRLAECTSLHLRVLSGHNSK